VDLFTMLDTLQQFFEEIGEVGFLTWDFVRYLCRRPFDVRLVIEQLDRIGWRSLNVVNLTALFTGMVLALRWVGSFPALALKFTSAVSWESRCCARWSLS
jgi:ABC-type transporter Mla maintaining outer membrane lipid asymmetry permease subunit MlaE